jgi:long-chain acyl-CoA synthetase
MVVYAEGRNYATALVTIDVDSLKTWAQGKGLDTSDLDALTTGPEVRAELEAAVTVLNSRLNRWETIKDFRVLAQDLSIEEGELTPSLKVKRKVVTERYADVLNSMYP